MDINIFKRDSKVQISLIGDLDRDNYLKVSEEIKKNIEQCSDLVLDLKECNFASIKGVIMLFSVINEASDTNCNFAIENLSDYMVELIKITGFDGIFKDAHSRKVAADIFMRDGDFYTHIIDNMKVRMGKPLPFGATLVKSGVNFSIFSQYATGCELLLFKKDRQVPYAIIPFPKEFRMGSVFSMVVLNIDVTNTQYGYRMSGPYDKQKGHLFNKEKILLDPYARAMSGRGIWGMFPKANDPFKYRGRILYDTFDWEEDMPPRLPMKDLVIYEAHVRGFTKDKSSEVNYRGFYAGIVEKIPYLKELGINCIELLPVFEFDETENSREVNNVRLYNYWGYSTTCFFAPNAAYAYTGAMGFEVNEIKTMIRELHKNGIEVILDVVFNHTAEGNENGPYISYRGIDNKTYYLLTDDGEYFNFSGCGNTFNCNNSVVRNSILDCLRYWVSEYHIDGFRFDLASILARDEDGMPLANPPLLEELAGDSILSDCKLIAEAWDAGGLYQVGSFPLGNRFAEWNGKYRDTLRKFIKGDADSTADIKKRIEGSPDLYYSRSANASVNFITCHDGFTLWDLVSYNDKHNQANGEDNLDGTNDNYSWNCGVEGETEDTAIIKLRKKQMKNALGILLLSRGIPMLLSGDEFCNTQFGNNNAYCQDNNISWLDWTKLTANKDIYEYTKFMIKLRKTYPVLRATDFSTGNYGSSYPELSWHGTKAWQYDAGSLCIAGLFCQSKVKYRTAKDALIYIAFNMHWEMHGFLLPELTGEFASAKWHLIVNTNEDLSNFNIMNAPQISNQKEILVEGRSIIVLVAEY